ncbi:HD domain-containing protein [Plebeiibacterium marinum]|uniref:HD domain-containing protein n=1 Tax=Plebeiibacterium marinum TaxID=2992111 RepID=A0AAE3MCK6_9BACT|nr:HD domain-containing protein [Plebeiobacterium marinum]MCW3805077.1 HD domain-containing protein [Plebeiobacterium marinum]
MDKNYIVNKLKIINDPVHGFVKVPFAIIYELLQHRFFQRLRGIKQLGLTSLVYPGAMHNRFQHAVGAMHLMSSAVSVLKSKGVEITSEESKAVHIAILLHDIGHGPFSHALESSVVEGVDHEDISLALMNSLNVEFGGELSLAIEIFKDGYPKKFLHQLVSSQLDMDRLDYLKRDSFFSGVTEGVIGSDRIIKMLHVADDQLVVESKGIYSIEKFLIARRLMYWQVYLHKTALVAELMLMKVLKRARQLCGNGVELFAPPQLLYFLKNKLDIHDFGNGGAAIENFVMLDDGDIMTAIKIWIKHPDFVLSELSQMLYNRELLHIELRKEPFDKAVVKQIKERVKGMYALQNKDEINCFVYTDVIENHAYSIKDEQINILYSGGEVKDISEASDILNLSVLGKNVKKNVLCYPKSLRKWVGEIS